MLNVYLASMVTSLYYWCITITAWLCFNRKPSNLADVRRLAACVGHVLWLNHGKLFRDYLFSKLSHVQTCALPGHR